MFMRFLGAGVATALCVVFCVVFSTSVSAAGETYSWVDYSKIGASNGAYREAVNASEGGTSALEFTQSTDNPAVFTAEPAVEKCQGTLTLTLLSANNTAALTSSGDCPLYAELSHNVTIGRSNLITSQVQTDSTQMKSSFRGDSCSEVLDDPTALPQCDDQVNAAFERHTADCKTQFDYTRSTHLAGAYLDCLAEKLGVDRPSNAPADDEEPTQNANCSIPDVGWLMCQAMEFMSWITDQAFNILSSMLEVEPLKAQINGEDSKLYAAWKVSLAFANVVFVFAFVFMLLSYTTNVGLGAYGIKKLAPRMIIAALLVNVSFYICGVAVDVSNILGGTLKNTLVEMTPPASSSPNYTNWSEVTKTVVAITPNDEAYTKDNQPGADREAEAAAEEEGEEEPPTGGQDEEENAEDKDLWPAETSVLLGGLMIAGGMVLWANLAVLVPFMATALVAIITVLIILIIRQAVIICLIAVSPIAMALYVLPNTKKWLDRWFDIFTKFLLIYPAVALVFGASYFASRVILDQAAENGQTFLTMFALGIQVIPLFITPVIMKFGAGVLDRFAGVVNNPKKGPLDAIKRKAGEFREDRRNQQLGRAAANAPAEGVGGFKSVMKNPNAARLRRNMKRDAADSAINSALARSKQIASNDPSAIHAAAKGIKPGEFYDQLIEESLAGAAKELNDIEVSRIHAAAARFAQDPNIDADALQHMALSGEHNGNALTDIERKAAVQMAANTAQSEKAHELIAGSGSMNDGLRRVLVDSLRKSGFTKQNAHFGGSAMNKVVEGKIGAPQAGDTPADTRRRAEEQIDQLVVYAAEGGKYSAAGISGQSSYALDKLNRAIDDGRISQGATERVISNAHTALNTPTLSNNINVNSRAGIERLAR